MRQIDIPRESGASAIEKNQAEDRAEACTSYKEWPGRAFLSLA